MSLLSFLPPRVSLQFGAELSLETDRSKETFSRLLCLFVILYFLLCLPFFFPCPFSVLTSLWLFSHDSCPLQCYPTLLVSSLCLYFILFFYNFLCACLDIVWLQLYSYTSQSLLPDESGYLNQPSTVCRASAPAAQHGPKSVVSHNLLLCQVIIGGRFAIPPYGIFFLLANVAWRLSYLIYVCDLVWYGSIVLERKTMFF